MMSVLHWNLMRLKSESCGQRTYGLTIIIRHDKIASDLRSLEEKPFMVDLRMHIQPTRRDRIRRVDKERYLGTTRVIADKLNAILLEKTNAVPVLRNR